MALDNILKNIRIVVDNEVKGLDKMKEEEKVLSEVGATTQQLNDTNKKGVQIDAEGNKEKKKEVVNSRDQLMGRLGVMFAGMALQRGMQNLTQTSKEWVGVGEIMSTTMGIVMLPAAMDLLGVTLGLSEAMLGLSEDTQMAIGVGAFTFEAIGGAAMFLGQAGLAGGALEQLFPKQVTQGTGGALLIRGTVGIMLGIATITFISKAITTDDLLTQMKFVFGAALGAGFAAAALGAGAAGALFLGTIVASATLLVVLGIQLKKGQQKRAAERFFGGGGQDKALDLINLINPDFANNENPLIPSTSGGSSGLGFSSKFGSTDGAQSSQTQFIQNNNFSGFGMDQVDAQISKNNQSLTSDMRRITNRI